MFKNQRESKNRQESIDLTKFAEGLQEKYKERTEGGKELIFAPGTPKMIRWLLTSSKGFIKKEKEAIYLLLAISGVIIIIALFLSVNILKGPYIPPGALVDPGKGLPIAD